MCLYIIIAYVLSLSINNYIRSKVFLHEILQLEKKVSFLNFTILVILKIKFTKIRQGYARRTIFSVFQNVIGNMIVQKKLVPPFVVYLHKSKMAVLNF